MENYISYYAKIHIFFCMILFHFGNNQVAQDIWTGKADMPTQRNLFTGSSVEGKLYAIGGCNHLLESLSNVEIYNPIAYIDLSKKPAGPPWPEGEPPVRNLGLTAFDTTWNLIQIASSNWDAKGS